MKLKYLIPIIIVFSVILDQSLPRIGDYSIRKNFQKTALEKISDLEAIVKSGIIPKNTSQELCLFGRIMLAYLYQECFQSVGEIFVNSKNAQGFRLKYYAPKPFLTFILPARTRESYYFQESYLGEDVLRVATNGTSSYIRMKNNWEELNDRLQ